MTLPRENVNTKQNKSLVECPSGSNLYARRIKFCEDTTIISRPSGLTVEGKITIVSINSATWTALPATALTDRNAICIQNRSGAEIKVNYDSGVSGYVGIVIPDKGERYYDITDDILIYAKSSSGTVNVTVEELA